MDRYIEWYNRDTNITHQQPSALTIAGISHLYFECIHPFEDGNGRIGRAIVIKALSQSIGNPLLIALSHIINKKKKLYYDALERNNKDIDITDWLLYFAETILEAQNYTLMSIEFLIKKAKFYDKFKYKLNARQEKVIQRIFEEGVDGFRGGLSADNYVSITSTSKATATRDLKELIELKALTKTGLLKGTRYYINFSES
jgi:Fic family protein